MALGPSAAVAAGSVVRPLASWRYYVCVGLLVAAAVSMQAVARYFQWNLRKQAVPLKKPLSALDTRKLGPAYRPHPIQPPLLDEENVQALGTSEYLLLRLVDTRRARTDPLCVANVFVTYYTGQPDMVPHVPDECYLAGGYDPAGTPEDTFVSLSEAPQDRIPVRAVQFQSRDTLNRPTVLYFFHVNGEYRTSRTGVRLRLANLWERHGYYAKIEVTFTDDSLDPRRQRFAGKAEALAALGPLLARLMPVLLEDHFAWDVVTGSQAARQP